MSRSNTVFLAKLFRWGNNLAVRLLVAVVEALGLKESDDIEIVHDPKRDDAVARLRALRRPLPEGFRFSRDDMNEHSCA